MPMLRSAWSGESLGFQNADPTKRGRVPAKGYRFVMTAGIQPRKSGGILDDADGVTPQRFLWLPANDPTAPDETPGTPQPLAWRPLTYGRAVRHVKISATARETIIAARKMRNKGSGEALDGHALYTRLKVAAALATLARRLEVSEEDWQLAGVIMDVSDRQRRLCESAMRDVSAQANKSRAEAAGVAATITGEVKNRAMIQKAAAAVKRRLDKTPGDWAASSDIRRATRADQRPYFEDAIDALLDAGDIEETSAEHGGRRFRRAV